MSEENSKSIAVVAAIIVDDLKNPQRVLVTQRSEPSSVAGYWEFPGGKEELGEEPTQALRRELHEELGIEVDFGEEFNNVDRRSGTWPLKNNGTMRLWFVNITKGKACARESQQALAWIDIFSYDQQKKINNEFVNLPWLEADIPIVEKLAEYFLKNRDV